MAFMRLAISRLQQHSLLTEQITSLNEWLSTNNAIASPFVTWGYVLYEATYARENTAP